MSKKLERLEEYIKNLSKSVEDLSTRVEHLEKELKQKKPNKDGH